MCWMICVNCDLCIYDDRSKVEGVSLPGMVRQLHKIRANTLPSSPKNIAEVLKVYKTPYVIENYGLTLRDDANVRTMFFNHAYENDDFAYCVFASLDIVTAIKTNIQNVKDRQFFIDGTFKVCPIGIFNQLLIVHINFMGQVSNKWH